MKAKNILCTVVVAIIFQPYVFAQWSGSGPRWRYNGQETMYVGSLQSGGQGFSFGYAWRGTRGAIEFWPLSVFKNISLFDESASHRNDYGDLVTLTGFIPEGQFGIYSARDRFGNLNSFMSGEGSIYGITKSFVVDHPSDTNLLIRYTSLEGSSPDMYFSGSSVLSDGVAVVEYPEHFSVLAKNGSHTITVTPRSPESKGLCVADRSDGGFVVAELFSGTGSYEFDYYVVAKRSGFDDYEIYLTKADDAKVISQSTKSSSDNPSIKAKKSFKDVTGMSYSLPRGR